MSTTKAPTSATTTKAALFGDIMFVDISRPTKPKYIKVCLGIVARHDGITRLSVEHKIDDENVDRRNVELPDDLATKLIEAITG